MAVAKGAKSKLLRLSMAVTLSCKLAIAELVTVSKRGNKPIVVLLRLSCGVTCGVSAADPVISWILSSHNNVFAGDRY